GALPTWGFLLQRSTFCGWREDPAGQFCGSYAPVKRLSMKGWVRQILLIQLHAKTCRMVCCARLPRPSLAIPAPSYGLRPCDPKRLEENVKGMKTASIRLYVGTGLAVALVLMLAAPARAQYKPKPISDPATGEKFHIEGSASWWNASQDL